MNEHETNQRQLLHVGFGPVKEAIEPGSFKLQLIQAFLNADQWNFAKLARVYSDLAGCVHAYKTGYLLENYPIIKKYFDEHT